MEFISNTFETILVMYSIFIIMYVCMYVCVVSVSRPAYDESEEFVVEYAGVSVESPYSIASCRGIHRRLG